MKKTVRIAILFFLLISATSRVMAQSPAPSPEPTIDPLFDTGCKPEEICHISPEKIARELKGDQPKSKTAHHNLAGDWWEYTQFWDGIVKPLNNAYHYGTDLLANFGKQIQDASFLDLTPADLQNKTLHDIQPKRFCVTSRLCVYHPVDGQEQFLTSETFCTIDPPNRKELIEGTRRLASYATNYIIGTDYRLPDTVVKKIAALPCGATMGEGRVMDENSIRTTKQNEYSIPSETFWDFTIPEEIVDGPNECGTKDGGKTQQCWTATAVTTAIEKGSAANSMAGSLAGISFTVTMEDLKPFEHPGKDAKEQLTKVGGLWNTYRNDAYDPEFKSPLDAIYENQLWEVTVNGFVNPTQAPTLQSMNARQENAQLFGNCSILNSTDSKYRQLGCDKYNWAAETSPAPPGPDPQGNPPGSVDGLPNPDQTKPPANGNNALTYNVPITNTNCTISSSRIPDITDLMERYYPTYTSGADNFADQWQDVQTSAAAAGINPVFALTLWIEESAAGGATFASGMGCDYFRTTAVLQPKGPSPEATMQQVACLQSYVSRAPNFTGFMCRYSGEERDSNDQCKNFTNNPNFIHGVQFWYNYLSRDLPASCQIQQNP